MKKKFTQNLIALCLLLLPGLKSVAQSTVFTGNTSISYENLSDAQKQVYDKVVSSRESIQVHFFDYNNTAVLDDNGFLSLSFAGECGLDSLLFKATAVDFEDINNFSWSGEYYRTDSTALYPYIRLSFGVYESVLTGTLALGPRLYKIETLDDNIHILTGDTTAHYAFPDLTDAGGVGYVFPLPKEFPIAPPYVSGGANYCGTDSLKVLTIFTADASPLVPNKTAYVNNAMAAFKRTVANSKINRVPHSAGYTVATTLADGYLAHNDPDFPKFSRRKISDFMEEPEVISLRAARKADLVVFMAYDLYPGISISIGSNFDSACVGISPFYPGSTWDDAHVFTHELGHILGARHNYEADNSAGLVAYNRGFRFTGSNGQGYATMMSGTDATYPTRIEHYSSADAAAAFMGNSTGNSTQCDNARRIREWWPQTAGYFTDMAAFSAGVSITGTVVGACQSTGTATAILPTGCYYGPYSYEWSYSDNGIDWHIIPGSNSTSIATEVLPVSHAIPYNFNARMYRVKVSPTSGAAPGYGTGVAYYGCMGSVGGMFAAKAILTTEQALRALPNPAKVGTGLNISFQLAEADEISLELYDVNGRKVSTLYRGVKDKGPHNLSVQAQLAAGYYQLIMQGKKHRLVEKLVMQ